MKRPLHASEDGGSQKLTPHIAEMIEAQAYIDWINSAPEELFTGFRAYTGKIGASTPIFTIPRVDWYTPNRVMGFGLFEPATGGMLDEIISLCKSRTPYRFFVPLCPETTPGNNVIRAWLGENGFRPYKPWVKLYRDSKPLSKNDREPQCEFEIKRIDHRHAREFAETVIAGFGYPRAFEPWLELQVGLQGWSQYLAFEGDWPVASGALFVKHGIGYLGLGSTLPSHRRKGAQEAIMRRRVHDGISSGQCKWFVTETHMETQTEPNPSYHNMLRTGFELAYVRENYVRSFA
ncbi:MAG TPA: hypothetical protein VFF30_05715 [Nitrososphaerales archaeon]|nr:hypothetical protein [Nitrososphaerales archaeon]